MNIGGIILCGGKSSRMGKAKALLPVGDETMLERVARILGNVVQPLVVVAAAGQELPSLPDDVIITRDTQADRGPLQGLRDGLAALPEEIDAVYATSCDVPLLAPTFVEKMIASLGEYEIVVPIEGKFHHPLAAVYRNSVLPKIEELLTADRLRPVFLFENCRTKEIPVNELRAVDASLATLLNCNRPEDYQAALAVLGLT